MLDTRVLFNYMGSWPSRQDRFRSDLLTPAKIETEYLKEITEKAVNFPKPVVLGGHSMISGLLYQLVDLAWETSNNSNVNVKPVTVSLED